MTAPAIPELFGGGVQVISVPATPELRAYTRELAERAHKVRAHLVSPDQDNLLKITADGRRAALCNGPPNSWPTNARTKVDELAERVWLHYCETDAERGTQLVFADLFTPKVQDSDAEFLAPHLTPEEAWESYGVYGKVKSALVTKGLCPSDVVFAHDYQTARLRAQLHSAIRHGEVRVCIGSTQLIGIGVNVQDLGAALHNLDCPWRPDELEQRLKRFQRQGNRFSRVHAYVYVTEGSYDPIVWQIVENKARWIGQLYAGRVSRHSAEDVGAVVLTASIARAVAMGDPRVLTKVRLEGELRILEARYVAWCSSRTSLKRDADRLPNEIAKLRAACARFEACAATCDPQQPLTLFGDSGQQRREGATQPASLQEANVILRSVALQQPHGAGYRLVGTFRGFAIWLEHNVTGAVLAAYAVGQTPDGIGPRAEGITYHAARPAESLARVLDVHQLEQEARLLAAQVAQAEKRLDATLRELSQEWTGTIEANRLLTEYDAASEGMPDRLSFRLPQHSA